MTLFVNMYIKLLFHMNFINITMETYMVSIAKDAKN